MPQSTQTVKERSSLTEFTLGIESSCDETAAAVVKDGKTVLSSAVSSSVHIHSKFGGVVPEIASRFHREYINAVTANAVKKAGLSLKDIGLIAATYAPGLVGSLLVGLSYAKGLSLGLGKPFVGVNHIHGHLFSSFLSEKKFSFPFIGLVVSGGHTSLALVRGFNKIEIIGKTKDDAAGEAYDKVAKILNLGYPGGPIIDRLAQSATDTPFKFRCAQLENSFDFSFSGIKTEVLYKAQKLKIKSNKQKAQISKAFQEAVVKTIVSKSIAACKKFRVKILSVGGGVACNSFLRQMLKEEGAREGILVLLSKNRFCLDNAAMIAAVGYHIYRKNGPSDYYLSASADAE